MNLERAVSHQQSASSPDVFRRVTAWILHPISEFQPVSINRQLTDYKTLVAGGWKLPALFRMKRLAWYGLPLVLTIPFAQAAEAPVWPAGVIDKNESRLLAFYDAQCSRYADQNGLTGEGREAFFSQCRENITLVFPAGYAEGGGGGE